MGLFDVGSLRAKKHANLKDASNRDVQGLWRKKDDGPSKGLGLYNDARHGASSRSLSANHASASLAPAAPGLHTKRSVSGIDPRNSARQSKLERMMGAGVPQIQVVSRQDHSEPFRFNEAAGQSSIDSNHYRKPSAARASGLTKSFSVAELNETNNTSYSRVFSSDISNIVGGPTTFTEMSEVDCPVCLEPLSHRLAGEKPHVVPVCGHALHNACFSAIYGPPEALLAAQSPGRRLRGPGAASRQSVGPPGMCGVCRKPIALGDGNSSKSQKLAGIKTHATDSPKLRSKLLFSDQDEPLQAHHDDFLEPQSSKGRATISSAASISSSSSTSYTLPTLRARPEFPTIYCKPNGSQPGKLNVVSVLSIEVPTRRTLSDLREHALDTISDEYAADTSGSGVREDSDSLSDDLKRGGSGWDITNGTDVLATGDPSRSPMPEARVGFTEQGDKQNVMARPVTPEDQGFSHAATPAGAPPIDPTRAVLDDLQQRVADWKGHSIEHFGPLVLHDLLNIRQDSIVREFHVYLFQEALLCVTEERRKGLGRFVQNGAASGSGAAVTDTGKPALKLKGRIYLRHIRRVLDSSVAGERTLSITMDDENLDQFVLSFRETGTMDVWRSRLTELTQNAGKSPAVPAAQTAAVPTANVSAAPRSPVLPASLAAADPPKSAASTTDGFGAARLSPNRPFAAQAVTSGSASVLSGKSGSQHGGFAAVQSQNSRRLSNVSSCRNSSQGHGSKAAHRVSVSSDVLPSYQQWSSSGGLDPRVPPPSMLPHTPIDLVLMISVPSVLPEHITGSISSSAALKLRLIRSSLDFVIHNLGPNDRVSLVAFTVGIDGEVKRTGLLNPHREASRKLLEEFVQNIGQPLETQAADSFSVDLSKLGGSTERIDSVTAVNVGLDVVLARKAKNPVTSMMLINDTSDGPKRNQMDLVMARAEAANVAIHCFGYGKTHDPSSLWLISNHTRGSYTFVREWYQLRECIAGCLGSMMSVALTDVKVHIGVPQDNCFRIRKIAGLPGAIISSSGKDVDIDIGEIKFGEAKDLLVELELDLASLLPTLMENRRESKSIGLRPIEQGSATDDFMQRMGIQDLSLVESDGADGFLEQMVEEIGVFEADVSFKDPATGMITSRLPNPGVLTLEIDTHSTDPLTNGPPGLAAIVAEPTVTRRRLEVLVSEMITRSLLLISRKNYGQALKVITETRRIIDTVVQALNGPNQSKRRSLVVHRSNQRRVREAANQRTISSLMAMMSDLDILSEGLEHQHRSSFDRDGRNFGAQQAMILRDQKAWTARTDTEYLYFRDDNAAAFTAWSASFASMR
ncbi:Zinc finger, RING-type [Kalmanozyma brasiliensis GHG001]|uniref:RING-type domain-containing protein n=1 Tax=Kalmanozyma brasiliensis (strain GHG001) TaxID=1365824 RepID=V5F1S4_KALBG|nr:Zinc finger, RING-type [Kalmanozyma brasiliensis GHG001]EST09284.1 Zinc finger, RING-type [Kalmanozyma brasiliensis GHG001]